MFVENLCECKQIAKKDYACIILTLSPYYSLHTAIFLSRVGYEDHEHFFYLSNFILLKYVYKVDNDYLCLVIPIKRTLKTVFVELLDQQNGNSYVIMQKHGEYSNPYDLNEQKQTIITHENVFSENNPAENSNLDNNQSYGGTTNMQDTQQPNNIDAMQDTQQPDVTQSVVDEIEARNEIFIKSILDITRNIDTTDVDDDDEITVSEDVKVTSDKNKVISLRNIGAHNSFCKVNLSLECVSGIFYVEKAHWDLLANLWLTPSESSFSAVECAINFPCVLKGLHYEILEGMLKPDHAIYGALFDKQLKVDKKPHMHILQPALYETYRLVHEEVITALASLYENFLDFHPMNVSYTDHNNSVVVIERQHAYNINAQHVLLNPLSPVFNPYYANRFQVQNYVSMLKYLGPSQETQSVSTKASKWTKFFIRNGEILHVIHANGTTVGDFPAHREDLFQMLNKVYLIEEKLKRAHNITLSQQDENQITQAVCTIIENEMKNALIVCFFNVDTGFLYVDFPLFPSFAGLLIESPSPTVQEMLLISTKIIPYSEFLCGYTRAI